MKMENEYIKLVELSFPLRKICLVTKKKKSNYEWKDINTSMEICKILSIIEHNKRIKE